MRHMNGRINSIMDRPLPRTPLDMKYELGEWKRKLSENYDLVCDPVWRIRFELLKLIAQQDSDERITQALMRLSVCYSPHINMYQHLAFLKRIAWRFRNMKWFAKFNYQQMVLMALE